MLLSCLASAWADRVCLSTASLDRRAEAIACRYNDECSGLTLSGANTHTWCNTRIRLCTWSESKLWEARRASADCPVDSTGCDSGYTLSPWTGLCVKNKGKTTTTPAAPSSTSSASSTPPASTSSAAAGRSCSLTVQCAGLVIPDYSHQWCNSKAGQCSWRKLLFSGGFSARREAELPPFAGCNSGFTAKGDVCYKNSGVTSTTPTATAPPLLATRSPSIASPSLSSSTLSFTEVSPSFTIVPTTTTTPAEPSASSNPYLVDANLSGISAFQASTGGWNTNSLVSWYHTNSAADSTNGNSW